MLDSCLPGTRNKGKPTSSRKQRNQNTMRETSLEEFDWTDKGGMDKKDKTLDTERCVYSIEIYYQTFSCSKMSNFQESEVNTFIGRPLSLYYSPHNEIINSTIIST